MSWLERLKQGLSKTRNTMKESLDRLVGRGPDPEVLEELETIRTIGEMLGDFDDVELADVISPADYLADVLEPEDADGPRLLKFPGIE